MQRACGAPPFSPFPALHSARSWPCQGQQHRHRSRHCLVLSAANGASADSLRTPHSGYHWDGNRSPFFEGWYWKVNGRPILINVKPDPIALCFCNERVADYYGVHRRAFRHAVYHVYDVARPDVFSTESTREDTKCLWLALPADRCWRPRR